jgi:hypothetical protein
MVASAPRIDERLLAALDRIDDPARPMAETHRRLGDVASGLGLARPSYERVRLLIHERRASSTGTGEVLVDVALRLRPPEALLDHISGVTS